MQHGEAQPWPFVRDDDYIGERDGDVVFRMRDGEEPVACRVTREALADYTHSSGRAIDIFDVHRELVELAASNVYDAGGSFDQEGRVLVTLAALNWAASRRNL